MFLWNKMGMLKTCSCMHFSIPAHCLLPATKKFSCPMPPYGIMRLELHYVTSGNVLWVGQGEVGGHTHRVQTAWPRLGLTLERPCLAPGDPFPYFLV